MLEKEEIEKIERYIDGKVDENDRVWIESQFLNGESNNALRQFLENDWDNILKETPSCDFNRSQLLDRIHHIIRKKQAFKNKKPLRKLIRFYMKAAAVLLIPVVISGALYYNYICHQNKIIAKQQVSSTIFAPLGSRVSFKLPDGTPGMLNSGSYLSYSLPFDRHRKVKLEGEAWFEVHHDEKHPFIIGVGNSTVKVEGTSFNLSAYPTENYVEVVLLEGKVEFQDKKGDAEVVMAPCERLVYKDGTIRKSVTDPAKYYAWTEGKLVFRGDPMAEVARRLERWYNIKVELANSELAKYSFRATFLDDKLDEVLRCLSMTSPIRYKITPRKLMQDGSYEKEKVTIYLKK